MRTYEKKAWERGIISGIFLLSTLVGGYGAYHFADEALYNQYTARGEQDPEASSKMQYAAANGLVALVSAAFSIANGVKSREYHLADKQRERFRQSGLSREVQ